MSKEKINLKEFEKLIIAEAEKIMSLGDPMKMDMNKMAGKTGNSKGESLVKSKENGNFEKKSSAPKAASNVEDVVDSTDVKMNDMDSDQGHDEKIAAAVSVDASKSTKSGPSIEGQHKAKFESKTDNPSASSSEPFEDRKDKVEMNSQDKATDDGAKTYVEPGSELRKGASTGQHKANYSEKAKNEKETAERIAKGIQLPENFKSGKELMNFIKEEAMKLAEILDENEKIEELFGLFDRGESVHKDEMKFLATAPEADEVKKLYNQYKTAKDTTALAKANLILNKYATKVLGFDSSSASAFVNGVYRVIEDKMDVPIKGRGAASAST